jgi:hypothetical protein
MRFNLLLILSGVLALVFGLAFFFVPVQTLALYSASTGPVGYLMASFFGAALIQVGLVFLLIRSVRDPGLIRAIAIGAALGDLAGLRVALFAVRNDMVNSLGWSSVVIYALLVLGFGWFAYKPPAAG